jgi:putative transposase
MPMSTFSCLRYHLVFSTQERRPWIAPEWQSELNAYLGGTVRGLDGVALTIGGIADHVHLLLSLKPTHTISDFVRELKKASSVWVIENHERGFAWQEGYSIFSVSLSLCDTVKQYVDNQEEHHRQRDSAANWCCCWRSMVLISSQSTWSSLEFLAPRRGARRVIIVFRRSPQGLRPPATLCDPVGIEKRTTFN